MLVRVENGNVYTVDKVNKTISGGRFEGTFTYTNACLIIGVEGWVDLEDGRRITLGVVVSYNG